MNWLERIRENFSQRSALRSSASLSPSPDRLPQTNEDACRATLAAVDGGIIFKLPEAILGVAANCEAPGVEVGSEAIG